MHFLERFVVNLGLRHPPPAIGLALLALVIAAAMFDIRSRRIPNWLTVSGAVLGLGINMILDPSWLRGAWFSLQGLLLAFVAYVVLYALRAMGAGDVKLMAAVGSMLGATDWFALFIITAAVGGMLGLAVAIAKGRLRKTLFNVAFILSEMKHGRPAYLKRDELDVKSKKAFGLPHGAVIAVASIIFLAITALYAR